MALAGSTATELGLIGAVVLVATLAFLFFLGDALQYAFSFVRKDMVTQVSKANGLTPEAFVKQWKGSASGNGQNILDPVQPTTPVVTAGSNGNEAQAEIYKALQALIDRSIQKGTMTEAQADLLKAFVKQHTRVMAIEGILDDAVTKAQEDFAVISKMEVQFEGETYLVPDLAAKAGLEWDMEFSVFMNATDDYEQSEWGVYDELYEQLEQSGLLDDPKVDDFLMDFYDSFSRSSQ